MRELPAGTVTFLFTDVEGSTRLLHELGAERYAAALGEHRRVVRRAVEAHDGIEVDTQGDSFFVAFATAPGALAAAAELAQGLEAGPVRVRVGVHTGTPLVADGEYVGEDVHLAARIAAAGHGGQILVSAATASLVAAVATRETTPLRDLGEHRLKDIERTVGLFQLGNGSFPPLQTISTSNLPRPASSFVGRVRELGDVLAHVRAGARLLTLTGPGGSGKSRLALEAAASVRSDFVGGVFWVGLAPLRDPDLVVETIGRTLGARDGVAEHIGERELLLVLDNFEQVIAAAPTLASLLEACPNVAVVVTSRELLRVSGEVEYPVPPLDPAEAVSLFCGRTGLDPSDEIAELCARLDNLPLAVELAAARAKALSPAQILERLGQRLDLLTGGPDRDARQQTLRATIAWSYELLSPEEQKLFRRLSVFVDGCSLAAAEAVGGDLDTVQALVEKSLLRFSNERYWMLETIRDFAARCLEDAGESEAVRRRHYAYFAALAEASASDLHDVNESTVSARLAPDYGNVRAAVSYALADGQPNVAARILGALYPFLISHGHLAEVREWVEATLAARDLLSERGVAEALVGGGEIARFAGDLTRAIELKEELASVEGDLLRPNWKAATLADLAEIALDRGDFASARRYAEGSARAGGGARAALCFAELALRTGDLAEAESQALFALAGFEEGAFNHACGLEILAETRRRAGDDAGAREGFSAALRSFAAIGDGGGVADSLDGLARLAAAAGESERAGRLGGAAQHLRETRGRRPTRTDVPLPEPSDEARDAARVLGLEEVIEYALGAP